MNHNPEYSKLIHVALWLATVSWRISAWISIVRCFGSPGCLCCRSCRSRLRGLCCFRCFRCLCNLRSLQRLRRFWYTRFFRRVNCPHINLCIKSSLGCWEPRQPRQILLFNILRRILVTSPWPEAPESTPGKCFRTCFLVLQTFYGFSFESHKFCFVCRFIIGIRLFRRGSCCFFGGLLCCVERIISVVQYQARNEWRRVNLLLAGRMASEKLTLGSPFGGLFEGPFTIYLGAGVTGPINIFSWKGCLAGSPFAWSQAHVSCGGCSWTTL